MCCWPLSSSSSRDYNAACSLPRSVTGVPHCVWELYNTLTRLLSETPTPDTQQSHRVSRRYRVCESHLLAAVIRYRIA